MIMPITWQYTDVYGVIIQYIADHLYPTNYLLNFSIIAINELRPKVTRQGQTNPCDSICEPLIVPLGKINAQL